MRRGAAYTLDDGLRLWDHDSGCGKCGKRLAEVLHDPSTRWNAGQLVCIDCGTVAPTWVNPEHTVRIVSTRPPVRRVALCSCHRSSLPTTTEKAQEWANKHLAENQGAA